MPAIDRLPALTNSIKNDLNGEGGVRSRINAMDIDQGQKDMLIFQAETQLESMLVTVMTNMVKSKGDQEKEIARNIG